MHCLTSLKKVAELWSHQGTFDANLVRLLFLECSTLLYYLCAKSRSQNGMLHKRVCECGSGVWIPPGNGHFFLLLLSSFLSLKSLVVCPLTWLCSLGGTKLVMCSLCTPLAKKIHNSPTTTHVTTRATWKKPRNCRTSFTEVGATEPLRRPWACQGNW